MPENRFVSRLSAGLAVSAGLLAGPATVQAAPPPGTVKLSVPMVSRGFDVGVANAHGYKVVLVDGRERSIKVSDNAITQHGVTAAPAAVVPDDNPVVGGNCGTSFLYYAAEGSRKALVHTGFDVDDVPAVAFSWHVSVTDNAGVGSRSWGDPLDFDYNWDTTWETSHSTTGYSFAQVTSGDAVLADGDVCVAGSPWESTDLY